MLIAGIEPRLLAAEQAVVDVLPVGWRDIRRLDAGLLDRVDQREQSNAHCAFVALGEREPGPA